MGATDEGDPGHGQGSAATFSDKAKATWKAAWELPYHLVGDEHLKNGKVIGIGRTWWSYLGLLSGFAAWYILIGVGTAGEEYVRALIDLMGKDKIWSLGIAVAVLSVPVVPAILLASTYRIGTPLGHFVRGASLPFQFAILFLVMSGIVNGLIAIRSAVFDV